MNKYDKKNPLWFKIVWMIVVVVEIYVFFINKHFVVGVLTLGLFCIAFGFNKLKHSRPQAIFAFVIGLILFILAWLLYAAENH
ncbi:hypothetical protein [Paenibacillus tianmuensis]|nr:hypothetical protein [Paenibacillus tianmuensis]